MEQARQQQDQNQTEQQQTLQKTKTPQVDTSTERKQQSEPGIPDYLKKYRTHQTIPSFFRQPASLPPQLAISDDRTLAEQVVNPSYERQKKIEQKRAIENAIQKVANIQERTQVEERVEESKVIQVEQEQIMQHSMWVFGASRNINDEDKQQNKSSLIFL